MKVGIFSDVFYPYLLGGGENRYYEVARKLALLGDKVTVVTTALRGSAGHEEPFPGVEIFRGGWPRHPLTHRSLASIPGYMAWASGATRKVEDSDILDLNTYASAIVGLSVARKLKKPVVVTVHDVFASSWLDGHNLLYGLLGTFSERLIAWLDRDGAILTVSEATKRKIVETLRFDERRVFVVPNGVDSATLRALAHRTPRQKEPRRIIYVGRLIGYKNVDHLLQIVRKLEQTGPSVSLDVVGAGDELARLQALSKKLGVEQKVRFHGFIEDKREVFGLVAQADVLVNPSYFEGFGMSLLEALAVGTPVVAYGLDAYKEFLADRSNCLLAERGHLEQLTDAVRTILVDDDLAHRLVAQGLRIAAGFDWMNVARRIREVYTTVIHELT